MIVRENNVIKIYLKQYTISIDWYSVDIQKINNQVYNIQYNPFAKPKYKSYKGKYLYQLSNDDIDYVAYHFTYHFIFPAENPRYLVLYRKISAYLQETILADLYLGGLILFHDVIQVFNFAKDKDGDLLFKFISTDNREYYIRESDEKIYKMQNKMPETIKNIWQKIKASFFGAKDNV